ncbi:MULTISPECIES: ABC transporter substrate-binding protein [unclassified Pseudoclavibacter]|uniref:ABC transporter substrate-binding protein n=1 Tax=unclassified Pseudoclavibacter TaxID=2615177 RepID=UPI0015E1C981|nr:MULTISPECIES: sugar ABC transporter substrate-binding protein [unclassified Pseudoclavibacter]MBS3180328.1 sugar ABC transporter substrate-binding protein [Pseudoclavibacter sp. Marseille-Q4354]
MTRSHPRRRKLTTAALAGALTATLALTACAGGGDVAEDGVVTLQLWDTDTRPERTESLQELISMFEAENPDIKIEYLGLPTDSYMQKIGTAIATNSTPDLVTPKASDLSGLVAQGALAPIDDLIEAGGWEEQLDPGLVDSTRKAVPDGALYMTPATAIADTIYYRADWLADAGLGVPENWDEFDAAAAALTDQSSGQFGYTIRGGNGFFPQFMQMVYTRAGIAEIFDESGKATLDDPAVIEAAQKYVDLYKTTTAESDLTADFKVMIAQFTGGGAGMLSHSIGSYPTMLQTLEPEQIAVNTPYEADNGVEVIGRLTTGFAMFEQSEKKEAASKFLEFTMGQEGNSFWAEASGYIPGNTAVFEDQWVQDNPAISAAIASSQNPDAVSMNVPYYLPEWTSITGTDMLPDWQRVLQGQMTVTEFCTKWADSLTEANERYQELTS